MPRNPWPGGCRRLVLEGAQRKGFLQMELVMVACVVALLAAMGIHASGRVMAILQVERVARQVALGLERGRAAAERLGRPCGLELDQSGWLSPGDGSLPSCEGADLAFHGIVASGEVVLSHNLPSVVRFSSNGLILDGGTILVGSPATELVRCLVISLPLGIVRHGRHGESGCRPDPT